MKIFEEIKKIIVEVTKTGSTSEITLESRLIADLGIDSLAGIELAHLLEDRFAILAEDMPLDTSSTVKDLVAYVRQSTKKTDQISAGQITEKNFVEDLEVDKSIAEELQYNPYYHIFQSGLGRRMTLEDREFISLGSNDYLGLANNPVLKDEAIKIIQDYGMSMCATPIAMGQTKIHQDLERKIASFLKQEDSIVYPSGYQANLSVLELLAKDKDIIIADQSIHSSLINGCRLSPAKLRFFPHNDMEELRKILQDAQRYRMRFLVAEGLYSTIGDIAPLDKLSALSQEYGAFIIIDDAHGVGVLGKEGRGILEVFDAYEKVGLVTGSLGKALGLSGGFITAKKKIIDTVLGCVGYFNQNFNGFNNIYSID